MFDVTCRRWAPAPPIGGVRVECRCTFGSGGQAGAARGWSGPAGAVTDAGRLARAEIEAETDRLAAQPYAVLGADELAELTDILFGLSSRIVAAGRFLDPNPIGLTWPPPGR